MKIKSININAFRGIPQLDLDLQGKSLLLQGENGTGKSSIVDAIEFFFTGKISHLPKNTISYLKSYARHVNYSNEYLKIIMEFDPGSIPVERVIDSLPKIPKSMETEFNMAKNANFILHRSQILRLIDSNPGNRYKFIGEILNLDQLEKTELELIKTQKQIEEEIEETNQKLENNKKDLEKVLGNDLNDKSILEYLNELIIKESLDPITSADEIEEYANDLKEKVQIADQKNITILEEIYKRVEDIFPTNKVIMEQVSSAEDLRSEILMHEKADLSLLELLKKAKEIISKDSEKCPLCEQNIEGNKLLNNIQNRLESLENLKNKKELLEGSLKIINEKLKALTDNLEIILSKIEFEELTKFKKDIESQVNSLKLFSKKFEFDAFLKDSTTTKDYEDIKNELETILKPLQESSEELKGSLKLSEEDENLMGISDLLLRVDKNIKECHDHNEKLQTSKKYLEIATKISSNFSEVKKEKIREVYDTIEGDLQRFYNILHPKDSHENINLDLDETRRASTNLKMTIFGREDEDPRALSSEGHLDSLGLCIFLALFKRFNADFPLMVLDDVVTTVDSRHRENVSKLLFEEFNDKQFIITTHDAIWFEQLRAAQRVYNLGNQFKNITIINWDLESGPEIRPYKVRWEKIEDDLKNGNKNCAANEGRRYLEWLLKEICNRTMAKIPSKYSERYEVNDLLNPARSRLEDLLKEEENKEKLKNSFDELEKTRIMGNLLSHENPMAGNVSIDEVERFCNSVHEIHKLTMCSNCQTPLRYYQDIGILRCSNKKCEDPSEIKTN